MRNIAWFWYFFYSVIRFVYWWRHRIACTYSISLYIYICTSSNNSMHHTYELSFFLYHNSICVFRFVATMDRLRYYCCCCCYYCCLDIVVARISFGTSKAMHLLTPPKISSISFFSCMHNFLPADTIFLLFCRYNSCLWYLIVSSDQFLVLADYYYTGCLSVCSVFVIKLWFCL